jgi:hypothetical protein
MSDHAGLVIILLRKARTALRIMQTRQNLIWPIEMRQGLFEVFLKDVPAYDIPAGTGAVVLDKHEEAGAD